MKLQLLGPMVLARNGIGLKLPASRKTRALLAYLAVEDRPVRRDRLCRLFWEMPDDPRGALRWSLSKLRGLLGEALVADRETVALDTSALDIDFRRLRDAGSGRVRELGSEQLGVLLETTGDFAAGIDLSGCDEYDAWRIAVAEDVRHWRDILAAELLSRNLPPAELLPFARAWVERSPHDRNANEILVRLLRSAARAAEAEQQRPLAIRRLGDAGIPATAALREAADGPPIRPFEQEIRFCNASDGINLAYSVIRPFLGKHGAAVDQCGWFRVPRSPRRWDRLHHRVLPSRREYIRFEESHQGSSRRKGSQASLAAFPTFKCDLSAEMGQPRGPTELQVRGTLWMRLPGGRLNELNGDVSR